MSMVLTASLCSEVSRPKPCGQQSEIITQVPSCLSQTCSHIGHGLYSAAPFRRLNAVLKPVWGCLLCKHVWIWPTEAAQQLKHIRPLANAAMAPGLTVPTQNGGNLLEDLMPQVCCRQHIPNAVANSATGTVTSAQTTFQQATLSGCTLLCGASSSIVGRLGCTVWPPAAPAAMPTFGPCPACCSHACRTMTCCMKRSC